MQENNNQNQEVELDENHLIQIRKEKLKELQEQGKNPFEITKYDRTNSAGEIKSNYEAFEQKIVRTRPRGGDMSDRRHDLSERVFRQTVSSRRHAFRARRRRNGGRDRDLRSHVRPGGRRHLPSVDLLCRHGNRSLFAHRRPLLPPQSERRGTARRKKILSRIADHLIRIADRCRMLHDRIGIFPHASLLSHARPLRRLPWLYGGGRRAQIRIPAGAGRRRAFPRAITFLKYFCKKNGPIRSVFSFREIAAFSLFVGIRAAGARR